MKKKMQGSSPLPPMEYIDNKVGCGPEIPKVKSIMISSEKLGLSPSQEKIISVT